MRPVLRFLAVLIVTFAVAFPTASFAIVELTTDAVNDFTAGAYGMQSELAQDALLRDGPALQITIPGLRFANPQDIAAEIEKVQSEEGDSKYIVVPYLGEYMISMYRYGIVSIGVIATVMIIISGMQWMIPSGSAGAQAAKERISRAIIGLLLATSSWLILYVINPSLVEFQYLKVLSVVGVSPEDLLITDKPTGEYNSVGGGNPSEFVGKGKFPGTDRPISNTDFDHIFKAFGNCSLKLDYRVLKAIAFSESHLNPTADNWQALNSRDKAKSYKGLFQTKVKTCEGMLKQAKQTQWANMCSDSNIFDPYLNTAVGYLHVKFGMDHLKRLCGSSTAADTQKNDLYKTAAYLFINAGPGHIKVMIKEKYITEQDVCDIDKYKSAFVKWASKAFVPLRVANYAPPGLKKYNYSAQEVKPRMDRLGVQNIFDAGINGNAQCPFDANPDEVVANAALAASNIPKSFTCDNSFAGNVMLAVGDSITANPKSYARQIASNCEGLLKVSVDAQVGDPTGSILRALKSHDLSAEKVNYVAILGGINNITSNPAQIKADLTAMYKQAKDAGAKVIGMTITPAGKYSRYDSGTWQPNIDAINSWIRAKGPDASDGNKTLIDYVIDANALLADRSAPDSLAQQFDSGDGLHPNQTAHTVLAFEIAKTVFGGKEIKP
ncbi:transglycosylase SLT domain-containing protein [Candidatus Nomurabacteria bacterium]|nr:transglycosylase SLT domain-containing protein [Candidatus Nomurabacteria bacterium]